MKAVDPSVVIIVSHICHKIGSTADPICHVMFVLYNMYAIYQIDAGLIFSESYKLSYRLQVFLCKGLSRNELSQGVGGRVQEKLRVTELGVGACGYTKS